MHLRTIVVAGLSVALAACTSTAVVAPRDPVSARWNGQSAGVFFAKFGPPIADIEQPGGATLYTWRGGYGRANKRRLVCEVKVTVSSSYTIRSVTKVVDTPASDGGPSRCAEFLAGA